MRVGLVAAVSLAGGCRTPHRSVAADVDPSEWHAPTEVVIPNADTATRCDLSLFLRFDERFRDDTLTLRIEVFTPDSLRCEEPFLFCVTHGRRPAALRHEAVADYRKRAVFAHRGDYRFRIGPVRPVTGIEAVGVYVERNE